MMNIKKMILLSVFFTAGMVTNSLQARAVNIINKVDAQLTVSVTSNLDGSLFEQHYTNKKVNKNQAIGTKIKNERQITLFLMFHKNNTGWDTNRSKRIYITPGGHPITIKSYKDDNGELMIDVGDNDKSLTTTFE